MTANAALAVAGSITKLSQLVTIRTAPQGPEIVDGHRR